MIGDQLRKSILQDAISGRLTERLLSDGNARDLLAEIRAEKLRLIATGELRKDKGLPISEDEVPFEIPSNWAWARLNEVVNFIDYRGMTPKKTPSGVRLITASNVKPGYLDESRVEYISEDEYTYRNQRGTTRKGDILFTTEAPLGHCCINPYEVTSAGQRIITLQQYGQAEISNPYLVYVILGTYFQRELDLNRSGMTAPGIKAARLKLILIPIPPLAEQERIVERLDQLLAEVGGLASDEEELKAVEKCFPSDMRKSILQAAISGQLTEQLPSDGDARELLADIRAQQAQLVAAGERKKGKSFPSISEDEIPFTIPENWTWVRFGDVLQFVNGRAYKQDELLPAGKYRVLRVGNLFTNRHWYYSDSELEDEKYCDSGDVLYSWSASFGPHLWDLGRAIFHYHIWKIKHGPLVKKYVYYMLLRDVDNIRQSTTGSAMVHVSMTNMMPRLMPLPPLAEQERIVKRIETLIPLCTSLE